MMSIPIEEQLAAAKRERDEARAEVERMRDEIERAAIACSHGESQVARAILLAATEAP